MHAPVRMRPIHLGLAAALLAVLTAGLWFFLEHPDSIARAAGRGGLALSKDGSPLEGIEEAGDAAEGTNAVASRIPLAPPDPNPPAKPAARKPGDPPRLHGRIVDAEARGIPGASVFAATGTAWIPVPLDIEPEGVPDGWFEVERTTTDGEGRFSFETLEPGTLRIAARAPGFAPAHDDHLELPDRPEYELADIALAPGVVLSGRVVDRERKGIAGATLLQPLDCGRDASGNEVAFPSRGVPLATTDADGNFTIDELATGPWTLVVDAPGFAVCEQSGRTRRAGERVVDLLFRVERGFEILGRVRAEDGTLPQRMRVSARPSPEDEERNSEAEEDEEAPPSASTHRVRHAIVATDGTFTVRGLQGGTRYALSLWVQEGVRDGVGPGEGADGGEDADTWKHARGTAAAHGYSGQRGIELVFRPEAALVFRVTDAKTGAPLPELTVWAGIGRERVLRDDEGEPVRSFPDGKVRYGGLRPKRGGAPVHLRIAASGYADHERKDIALAPSQTLELGSIALEPEHVVLARVVDDETGGPVEGARVLLGTKTGKELLGHLHSRPEDKDIHDISALRFARTDARGTARLTSLPGKSSTAVADAPGYLASEPVTAFLPEDGDHEIELRLRKGGTVVVSVRDPGGRPVEGIPIQKKSPSASGVHEDSDDDSDLPKTDPQGVVRFEALEPGVHAFRARDRTPSQNDGSSEREGEGSQGWVEAVAKEGSTETLELTVPSRGEVFGVVRESGTPLAGARLRLLDPGAAEGRRHGKWQGEGDPLATVTDADGRYRFAKIRAGGYTLEIAHGTRRMAARFPVAIEDPPRAFDVDLDVAILQGRVVGEDGDPIEGIEIQCLNAAGQSESGGSYRVLLLEEENGDTNVDYREDTPRVERTDANGHYELRGVRSEDPVRVQASGDTVQPETKPEMTLGPDEIRRNVDFVLKHAGAIEVVLVGGGSPSSGRGAWYQVRATQIVEEGKSGARAFGHVGTWNPKCRLRSLAAGRYRVELVQGGRANGQVLQTQEIDVVARETAQVSIQAP